MVDLRNSHLRDCITKFFHPDKNPLVLGDLITIDAATPGRWPKLDQSKFLYYLVLYSTGPKLAMKVHEIIKDTLAGGGQAVVTLLNVPTTYPPPIRPKEYGGRLRAVFRLVENSDLMELRDLVNYYFINLGVAMYNPPGRPPHTSSVSTPNLQRSEEIQAALDQCKAGGRGSQAQLKGLVIARDGNLCPLSFFPFRSAEHRIGSIKPMLACIIPVWHQANVIAAWEMFTGDFNLAETFAKHINDPQNAMCIQYDVHKDYDTLNWSIEAVPPQHTGGEWKYIYRRVGNGISPFHKLQDGDHIGFGRARDRSGLSESPLMSPNPIFCNLHYAVARMMRMSGAAKALDLMEEELGDGQDVMDPLDSDPESDQDFFAKVHYRLIRPC